MTEEKYRLYRVQFVEGGPVIVEDRAYIFARSPAEAIGLAIVNWNVYSLMNGLDAKISPWLTSAEEITPRNDIPNSVGKMTLEDFFGNHTEAVDKE